MGEHRNSWVVYDSFNEVIQMLPTQEERTQMLWALWKLGFENEIDPELPLHMKMALTQMQASISGAKSRHDIAVENGRKGGKAGAGDSKRRYGNKNASKRNLNVNENDNANVNGNVNENVNNTAHIGNGSIEEPTNALTTEEQIRLWEENNGI